MDKNQKFKNFMKKEGFYVALFVCLCLVATVAVVTAKRNVKPNIQEPVVENSIDNENSDNEDSEETNGSNFEDAELVDGEENLNEDANQNVSSGEENPNNDSVATSATPQSQYISPVKDGVITRLFNIKPRMSEDGKSATVYKGVDIESTQGTEVRAISDGKVIEATKGTSKDGYYIKVEHSDGVVATYANLSEEMNVKEGDVVSQGAILGTVGNTIQNSPEDRVSENYLLFHMEKSKEPINPQEYIKDIPVK